MPVITGKKKKGDGVASLFDQIDLNDASLLTFTDEEARLHIEALTITGTGKTPEQVDEEASENFQRAIKSVKFARMKDAEKELNSVLPKEKVAPSMVTEEVSIEEYKKMYKSALFFSFLHGNVTEKKYWFQCDVVGEKKLYASFPELDVNSRRSTLVHVFREEISKLLEKYDNTLITVLNRSNIKIDQNKRKYCFPKGHLLVPVKEIQQVRTELGRIFEQMKNRNLAERKFDLPWFTGELEKKDEKKDEEKEKEGEKK